MALKPAPLRGVTIGQAGQAKSRGPRAQGCKILEHIICHHINSHLDANDILSKFQHGFRSEHSCESQLILTVHDLMKHHNNRQQVDLAVLDFSKAFDMVLHERLLGKLHHYGIDGPIWHWIRDFLTTRTQCVVVDGECSSWTEVDSGVPQQTVLGPLLFPVSYTHLTLPTIYSV